jgi:hypothetical protein
LSLRAALLSGLLAGAAQAAPAPVSLAGAWSVAERAEMDRALARLPEVVRAQLPRTVTRDARGCDADAWPDDDDLVDGQGGVHVCARAEAPAAVARRVVTALLMAFDRGAGWSEEAGWRRLGRWRVSAGAGFRLRAENASAAGFADPRGRRSPRWDLATFLAASWLDPADAAGGVSCRLMSQAAFVRERLAALSGASVPAPACPAFEGWADLDRLRDVEVVLAAPSTAMVGSLFGHVFLRMVYRDDDGEAPDHLSRTVAFLADNDVPFQADRAYALKGIAGFYTATLHERPYLDAYREYVVTEGRDLRRWRLNLTAGERAALAARLWTVLHGGQYAYYFFRQNCATLMMDLIDEARAPGQEIARAGLLAAPPASTLETWAAARGADGGPLLQFVPETVTSLDHEARLRSRHRAALEPRIIAAAPPALADALVRTFADARGDGPRRAGAYERLATLLGDARAGQAEDVRAWLGDGAAVESYLSVAANLQAEARADVERRARARAARDALAASLREGGDATIVGAVALVGDAEPDRRMEGYRRLRAAISEPGRSPELVARLRLLALLESEVRYDVARMRREPGLRDALLFEELDESIGEQPYVRGRADLVTPPLETTVAAPLLALQRARQSLFATRGLAATPADAQIAEAATERSTYDASLSRSGIDQLAVSAGLWTTRVGAAPALSVGGALYDERLGDRRRFGFDGDTSFVVARSELALGWAADTRAPTLLGYDARLLGYRSLRTPLPEAGARRGPPGWELFVDLRGSQARAVAAEVTAGWGVLGALLDRGELSSHILAGLDVSYVGVFPTADAAAAGKPQALALPAALEARAALGVRPAHRSWLAARVEARPLGVFAGAERRLAVDVGASAECHLALGSAVDGRHDPALLVRAQGRWSTLSLAATAPVVEAALSVGVELR